MAAPGRGTGHRQPQNIRARIDQPGYGLNNGTPTAEIFVDKVDSAASGKNTQLQDVAQDALVKRAGPKPYFCPPIPPSGHASNLADGAQNSRQDVDSSNRIDVTENIGGRPRPYRPDPSVTRLNSDATGDNLQAQSAAQQAITNARNYAGANASNVLSQRQNSAQDVDSGNRVNMVINDRRNLSQLAIGDLFHSASTATNIQDQAGAQSAESAFRGSAINSSGQSQWSDQDAGSGNWLNIRM